MRPTAKPRRGERMANYFAAFAARRARTSPAFTLPPEPRSSGLYARGKQMLAGRMVLAGHALLLTRAELWGHRFPAPEVELDAHGFDWLDDLAAVGTPEARDLAQHWFHGWLARYSRGKGLGWAPDLAGRRLIRLFHHSEFLQSGHGALAPEVFFNTLAHHAGFLRRRAAKAAAGRARLEALLGLLYAGLSLSAHAGVIRRALDQFSAECAKTIDETGAIPSRNPEELLEILTLLTWAAASLKDAGHPLPAALAAAIDRIAPHLRLLRHVDGGLARFHGGGVGPEGRLDHALAASHALPPPGRLTFAMGYARLSGARTSLIVDAAAPPEGAAMRTGHASTAAFELTSGRRPLIVSCGSGLAFGRDWAFAGRATQSHSALSLNGLSSSRFSKARVGELDLRAEITDLASPQVNPLDGLPQLRITHDGWLKSHGLHATREITLMPDGRTVLGADYLNAFDADARAQFRAALAQLPNEHLAFSLRFHLHPDVTATLDADARAVTLTLRSGEVWVLRLEEAGKLSLEPSVYLETAQLEPKHSLQVVISEETRNFDTRIGWTLAKAQDTPLAIRDLGRDLPV